METIALLHKKAQAALGKGEYQQAHQYLIALLQQDKYFADAYFLLAMIASAHQNLDKAIQLIEQAIKLSPENAEYLAHLAKHYALKSNHTKAIELAELAAKQLPVSALTLDTIGVSYSQIGLHQEAIPFFNKAVGASPNNSSFLFNLAVSQTFVGDFEGARNSHEKVVSLAPDFCKSHLALSSLGGIDNENNHIERLTKLFPSVSNADDRLCIGHALAREYETLGNFDKAFRYLQQAKDYKLATTDYDFSQDKEMFSALQHAFGGVKPDASSGYLNKEPLFVVGMPRTGTTLVERILSQHSDVTSAGELEYFALLIKRMAQTRSPRVLDKETVNAAGEIDFNQLGRAYIDSTRAITGKTAKFVDKMPFNVLYVGFILQALPQAKIVCLDRNPLDTIVSNFRQLFTAKTDNYNYAYGLASITQFYVSFKELVTLWQEKFPENFYLVNYEKLVNEPEAEARKLVEFCGLNWQTQCLNINDNSAPVATASAVQVRQPINNKSVGNWRKYQDYLDETIQLLEKAGIGF